MIAITKAVQRIARQTRRPGKRIHIVQGGMRAGKTYAILLLIADFALDYPGKRIAVFSHSYPHLRRGAIRDFVAIMQGVGRYDDNAYNRSNSIYTFPNGTTLEFISVSEGLSTILGTQYDISYVNEAIYIDKVVFDRILVTTKRLFVDFNPTRRFYVHDLIGRDDVTYQILTYKDNQLCPKTVVEELERIKILGETNTYWRNYYRVYGEGEIGHSIDSVYPDWKYADTIPPQANIISIGVDFGYTNDVTAIVAIYYVDGIYYVDEVAYSTGLTTAKIAEYLRDLRAPVYADNSEPRLIAELKSLLKRQDIIGVKYNVRESIDALSKYEISIPTRCANIIQEHQNYVYKRDKYTGDLTNDPVTDNNHAMDAIRYGIIGHKTNGGKGKYIPTF